MKTKPCELVLTHDLAYYPCTGAVFARFSLIVCFGVPFYAVFLGRLKNGPMVSQPLEILEQWADLQDYAASKARM